MRRKYTDYLVIVISMLTVLVSAYFAISQTGESSVTTPASEGAASFALQCASCHTTLDAARPLVNASDIVTARAELMTFLADHGDASANEIPALVAFLAQTVQDGATDSD